MSWGEASTYHRLSRLQQADLLHKKPDLNRTPFVYRSHDLVWPSHQLWPGLGNKPKFRGSLLLMSYSIQISRTSRRAERHRLGQEEQARDSHITYKFQVTWRYTKIVTMTQWLAWSSGKYVCSRHSSSVGWRITPKAKRSARASILVESNEFWALRIIGLEFDIGTPWHWWRIWVSGVPRRSVRNPNGKIQNTPVHHDQALNFDCSTWRTQGPPSHSTRAGKATFALEFRKPSKSSSTVLLQYSDKLNLSRYFLVRHKDQLFRT